MVGGFLIQEQAPHHSRLRTALGVCSGGGGETFVIGTVSRTGVAGLLIVNTAEKILRQVDCSVLTVKPDEFVTPVRLDE